MKLAPYDQKFILNGSSIDEFSEILGQHLEEYGLERRNILRVRLSIEESLLNFRDRFGENASFRAIFSNRFNHPAVIIEVEGDPFNPLSRTANELEAWSSSLLSSIGMYPQYSHDGKVNVLRLALPVKKLNPAIKIFASIAAGVFLGLFISRFVDPVTMNDIIDMFMTPVFNVWLRILNVLSGPVVFFMVINTIVNTSAISRQGGSKVALFGRYFAVNFLFAIYALFFVSTLINPAMEEDTIDSVTASGLLDQILQIVPENFLSPFIESNTVQLMLIAAVIANAIAVAGEQAKELRQVFGQINMIGMLMAEWISKLVPFFIVILLAYEIIQHRVELLRSIWIVLLMSLILSFIAMLLMMLYTSQRKGVPPGYTWKKIMDPFVLTIREGSIDAAYGLSEQTCISGFGIDRDFTEVGLAHGLVLYMPASVIGIIVFTVFAASQYGVPLSTLWYIKAVIIAVLMFEATPPVPGANLLAYTVVVSALGVPAESLIDAMIFDIVFGIFASAINQAMLQLELIEQSDKLGLLNHDILDRAAEPKLP